MLTGCAFLLLAAVGIVRMPDIFTRMSASSKATTLGVGCMLIALALHFRDAGVTTKVLLVIAFFFLKAPVAAHVLARAAYRIGTPLWKETFVDELREYYDREEYLMHRRAGVQKREGDPSDRSSPPVEGQPPAP